MANLISNQIDVNLISVNGVIQNEVTVQELLGPPHPIILPVIHFNTSPIFQLDPNEKLREFLMHDYKGLSILSTFDSNSQHYLTNDTRKLLVNKLIDRETDVYLSNLNFQLGDQIEEFKIETARLTFLAEEIGEVFDEEPGLYFTAYCQVNGIGINASGKLWERYNYVKKHLRNSRMLKSTVPASTQPTIVDQTDEVVEELTDDQIAEKLEFLKSNLEPWNRVLEDWRLTYIARKKALKNDDSLSLLSTYRCLHQQTGILLIHQDFSRMYKDKLDAVETSWSMIAKFIEEYSKIDEQLKNNSEAQELLTNLPKLSGNTKQVALLLLLGFMLKPTNLKPLTPKPSRKRKLGETNVETPINKAVDELRLSPISDFIVKAEVEAKVNEIIDFKKKIALEKKEKIQPYMIFVGNSSEYKNFYVITDIINYQFPDPLKALQFNFELFYTLDWQYPKPAYNIWIFIQKIVFEVRVTGNHYCAQMKKMVGYITRKMKIKLKQ